MAARKKLTKRIFYLEIEKFSRSFVVSFAEGDPVAQLVEHLTFNQRAEGSNPSGVTENPLDTTIIEGIFVF